MARNIRNTDPTKLRLITIRTVQAQLLLKPSEKINEIIGGILAKYQERHNITLYAFTFNGNHYHLVAQAEKENIWKFEHDINREISKRVNWHIKRSGFFWGRRYDDQIILEDNDALEAVLYTVCNPVSHGLVSHPKNWPGLNCYWQLLDERDRIFTFMNYTAYKKALAKARLNRSNVKIEDYKSRHVLKISRLPQFQKFTYEDYKTQLTHLIEERIQLIHKERLVLGKGFLGRKGIVSQSPFSFPKSVKKSPRSLCYTKNQKAKKSFMEKHFLWLAAYKQASRLFRSGEFLAIFPPFSLRPPSHFVPSPI